jgi:hypothetical protein
MEASAAPSSASADPLVVAPLQRQQPAVPPRTHAPPACLSRSAVATLQTALALVVVRQRHVQRRQRDEGNSSSHDTVAAGKRRRQTAAARGVPAVGKDPLALPAAAAHRVKTQVHYLWAAALDEVVATARQESVAADASPPVRSAALLRHLRTAWHTWLPRDAEAARAGVVATLQSRTTSTSTTAALWTALLVRPANSRHDNLHADKHALLARVVYESVDDLVRTSGLWQGNHVEEDNEEANDSLAHLLPLLRVWQTARDIRSSSTDTPMDDPLYHDDHPRRGLLPGDLTHAWASPGGWTDRVDALWLHHAWGVAARPF